MIKKESATIAPKSQPDAVKYSRGMTADTVQDSEATEALIGTAHPPNDLKC